MAAPQGCAPALYDIMLECWHKVNLTANYSLSFFCFIWVSTFSPPTLYAGPDEAADLWDTAVEVGRLLHHVRLRVQGSFRLLTVVCVSGSKKQSNFDDFSHHVFPAGNPEALTPTAPPASQPPKVANTLLQTMVTMLVVYTLVVTTLVVSTSLPQTPRAEPACATKRKQPTHQLMTNQTTMEAMSQLHSSLRSQNSYMSFHKVSHTCQLDVTFCIP